MKVYQSLRDNVARVRGYLRYHGFKHTAQVVRDRLAITLFERLFRSAGHPSLEKLHDASLCVHLSAFDLIRSHFHEVPEETLAHIREEYEALQLQLKSRYTRLTSSLTYPVGFATEEDTSFLLYALARILRPTPVLESGVANGHSSFFLTNALLSNVHGTLYSVEVTDDVGALLSENEKVRWHLEVLEKRSLEDSFARFVDKVSPIDIFLHDSDHSYGWQAFEYNRVSASLTSHGILISDDVDASFAFLDFCKKQGVRPILLVGKRRVYGIVSSLFNDSR